MKRSQKIIVLSHCLLNANAKVLPLAGYRGVLMEAVMPFIREGSGLFQLPCPESSYLGINRWGMSKAQYDHPNFKANCHKILTPVLDQLETFHTAGYEITGVVGVDGSPNCGVSKTPAGLKGGVIRCNEGGSPFEDLRFINESGVFITVFKKMLAERNLQLNFMAIDENNPSNIIYQE